MQRIVKGLGDVKELLPAGDHFPAGRHIHLFHQRDKSIENFGDTAADGGGIDHFDVPPRQSFREFAQLQDFRLADNRGVVLQDRQNGFGNFGCAHRLACDSIMAKRSWRKSSRVSL
jgi:hypothetical protein